MRIKLASSTLAAAALSMALAGPAVALPPGGANTVDSEGTSASVTQTELSKPNNCTLNFEVRGWTPGMTVNAKVDDGALGKDDQNKQGAAVWATAKVDSKGVAKGSMDLCDRDIPAGKHYLRFVGHDGTKGLSTRGNTDFTWVEAATDNTNQGGANAGGEGSSGGMVAIIAVVIAILGAIGAVVSGAIPGLPRP